MQTEVRACVREGKGAMKPKVQRIMVEPAVLFARQDSPYLDQEVKLVMTGHARLYQHSNQQFIVLDGGKRP